MRTFTGILFAATIFLCNHGCAIAGVANVPLSFYIVSQEKIVGGRFIDTSDFPKLGYIATAPDFVITSLNGVDSIQQSAVLRIQMHADDARKFTALTERAAGKRFLLMLGDRPLIAPRVMAPISTRSILLNLSDTTDKKKIEDGLKRLVDN